MSLKDRLEAELRRCQAECEAIAAELKQIMVKADPQRVADLEPAIGAVLKRLKEASDRLQDLTSALTILVQTRGQ
jgi:hypothetical protein